MESFKDHFNSSKKHVKFIGVMQMSPKHRRIELFNLLHDAGGYPIDSTLTRETLDSLGIEVPPFEELVKGELY